MISEQERVLSEHLSTQRVIIKVIVKRISYLRFFINNNSTPNNFLLNAMIAIRAQIILDLCKLFIKPLNEKDVIEIEKKVRSKKGNKSYCFGNEQRIKIKYKEKNSNSNFFYVFNRYKDYFKDSYGVVKIILDSVSDEIDITLKERNKQLAHKDFKTGHAYQVFIKDKFEILEKLTDTAVEIFKLLQKDIRGGNPSYDESVDSLKEVMNLVKKSKEERDKKYIEQAFKHKKRAKD
ncbi:hypothetical protein [Gaetbulibacter sp. PBL-D1]|uniref:hypothetical protein n=1 Tax=Gaetbulibacter sp. PBL-D1 TaxID=3422594 RepID=UPI003D2EB094